MKPPPRARSKPNRYFQWRTDSERRASRLICTWKRSEQRQLLSALKKLRSTVDSAGEIDYAFLNQYLPQRTIPEIYAVVEALRAKAITSVKDHVRRQRLEEERAKKPIELWSDMASTMTGALGDPICAAFSQMLIVSSTEPRSLRNSDPPHVRFADGPKPPGDRTIPFRPVPHPVVPGQRPGTANAASPLLILKTPVPTIGSTTRLPAPSQVVRLVTVAVSTPQPQPSKATPVPGSPQLQHPPNTSQASAVSVKPLSQTETPPASPRVPVRQPPPSGAISSTPSSSSSPSPAVPPPSSTSIPATVSSSTTSTSSSTPPTIPSSSSPSPAVPPPSSSSSPTSIPAIVSTTSTSSSTPPTIPSSSSPSPAVPPPSSSPTSIPANVSTTSTSSSTPPTIPSSSSPSPAVPPPSSSSSPTSIRATVCTTSTSSSTPPTIPSSSSPTPAAALHARFGRTSKYAREDSPRALGMKCIVDFEKIYRYLSAIHNERQEIALTPMESAVVLDLLMSLPEELPLLDCNELKRHMMKVHTQLSAPIGPNMAGELFEDQRSERQQDGVGAGKEQLTPGAKAPQRSSRGRLQTQVGRGGAIGPNQGRDRINSTNRGDGAIATVESPGNLAAEDGAESSVAAESATAQRVDGRAQSQSSESNNTFSQSGDLMQEKPDWEKAGLRPLNPFMVPLKLLARHHCKEVEAELNILQ